MTGPMNKVISSCLKGQRLKAEQITWNMVRMNESDSFVDVFLASVYIATFSLLDMPYGHQMPT